MQASEFASLIARLEGYAARRPGAYRLRVLGLAGLGYAYLFGVLLALVGVNGGMAYALFLHPNIIVIKLALKLGIPVAVLSFMLLRALWVCLKPPAGIPLARRDSPALFALIDDIRARLRGPRIHRVLLTGDFNAGVVQVPRLGIFGWQRNYLLLGLPLLHALSPPQFSAVLAHEYGHLSAAHGRFGNWIYRIRLTWQRVMDAFEARENWGGDLFRRFFRWYIPYFNAYSFVLARANEYQADRSAAQVAGSEQAAQALLNVALKARFLEEQFWPRLYAEADHRPAPPYQPYLALAHAFAAPTADAQRQWLAQALQEKTGTRDTHPCLAERLAALGVDPAAVAPPAEVTHSAARQYFGERLAEWAEALDRAWLAHIGPGWEQRHAYVQEAQERLRAFRARPMGMIGDEELLSYAQLSEEFAAVDTLSLYRALLARNPRHAQAHLAVGRLLLMHDEAQGVAALRRAMELSGEAIVPACELLYSYRLAQGREAEAETYKQQALARLELEARAKEERDALRNRDEFLAHEVDATACADLAGQLQAWPEIKRAYLARKAVRYLPESPLYVLGVERRFRLRLGDDSGAYAQKLAETLRLPGECFVVVAGGGTKKLLKKLKKLKGTQIYP